MEDVTKRFHQINRQRLANLYKAFGYEPKDEILQKSDVYDAIEYSSNIKLTKTGKEIKDQLEKTVKPLHERMRDDYAKQATELLKVCGDAPTQECDDWTFRNFPELKSVCMFKVYTWREIDYYQENNATSAWGAMQVKAPQIDNPATSKDVSDNREKYNQLVRKYIGELVDIKTCDMLINNLKDKESIQLTPKQIVAFGFD